MDTTQILANLAAYAVQIGLLVAIGAALPALLRLKSPPARLLYWQILLVACLTLPWLRPWKSEVVAVAAPVFATQTFTPLHAAAGAQFTMPPPWQFVLWALSIGVAMRLIWLAVGLLKLSGYRRHGRALPLPPEWSAPARNARLLVSDQVAGPVTFGFFRPVVLLPAGFESMPAPMREAILFHELLHVERRDWLFTFGEELLRAVFWFHPAIWWVLGEIQLAREQTVDRAVIDMTQARDPYVDALLAMAGVSPHLDLAPAPLFLRRRHLKQRVLGIVKEIPMSKTRLILAQAAALALLAVACWVVTGAIPLHAQSQLVADSPGVTVQLNGSQLMHRSAVRYPPDALAKGVEGTVVVQVRLDASGEVTDDTILSGPDELRRSVQQAVLDWHFDRSEAHTTQVVNIDFVKPAEPYVVTQAQIVVAAPTPAAPSQRMPAQVRPLIQNAQAGQTPANQTIDRIDIAGLTDSARDELLAALPVHVGDPLTNDAIQKTAEAVHQFDEHLTVGFGRLPPSGHSVIRISAPGAPVGPVPAAGPIPAGAVRIGGIVEAANLISPIARPVYPPLAKMARQQGTVELQAIIGKDGAVEDLQILSGPPLLIQSAVDAVKQWTYRPTFLNGAPVEVVTTVNVNFFLSGGPPPTPAQ